VVLERPLLIDELCFAATPKHEEILRRLNLAITQLRRSGELQRALLPLRKPSEFYPLAVQDLYSTYPCVYPLKIKQLYKLVHYLFTVDVAFFTGLSTTRVHPFL
jgi:hypothetical protein